MYSGLSVCVVIPAHNEQQRLPQVLAGLPGLVDRAFVIDDGSTDLTADIAAGWADPRVVLVRHPRNRGVGASISTGYALALDQGLDVAVVMAGDGQMDPTDLPALLEPIARDTADYVKGNRFMWPGVAGVMPLERLLGNLALSWMTRATSGYSHIMDSQCGYTALRVALLALLPLHELVPRYGYPNDLLAMLHTVGARVAQVPVRPVYFSRTSGLNPLRVVLPLAGILARSGAKRLVRERLGTHPADPGSKAAGK